MRLASTSIAFSLALLTVAPAARAGDVDADPTSYQAALAALMPGDTLHLAAGHYPLLVINGLNGTASSPITISGAPCGASVIDGDASDNTVEIIDSSYVVLSGLTVDSKGLDGVFGISAKGGTGNTVHHVTVEGCTLVGQGASQQTDGISTKTPTWGWVIRGNVIDGAGTGLYLGNSDGSDPFVGGLIEGNLIKNTVGYGCEVKHQSAWPTGTGLPTGPNRTIFRNNVFLKNDQPSPDGDRPNLYLGGQPGSGPGAEDLFEVYGNFFFHNPRESLLQFEGRATVHDNVFVDANVAAIAARQNDLPLQLAHIYDNTIYTTTQGIQFGSAAGQGDFVVGNLIFAATPIGGPITTMHDNLTDTLANAGAYVNKPSSMLGAMDFYPQGTKATGPAVDLSSVATDTDYDEDFDGTKKGGFTYRGAYAGSGQNPGWALADALKTGGPSGTGGTGGSCSSSSGGTSSSGGSSSGGTSSGGTGGAGTGGAGTGDAPGQKSGCSCEAPGRGPEGAWAAVLGAAAAVMARRRRQRARGSLPVDTASRLVR